MRYRALKILTALLALLFFFTLPACAYGNTSLPPISWVSLMEKVKPAVVVISGEMDAAAPVKLDKSPQKHKPLLRNPILILEDGAGVQSFLKNPVLIQEPSPRRIQFVRRKIGTGVIIHPAGFVLTNAHLITDVQNIRIVFSDGRAFDADIAAVGIQMAGARSDSAILKIKNADGASFPFAPIAAASSLQQSAWTLHIGHPYGLRFTANVGTIASTPPERDLQDEDTDTALIFRVAAVFPPGSSGSPVFNTKGEILGIIFGSFENSHYPGVALLAEPVVKKFIKEGKLPPLPPQSSTP